MPLSCSSPRASFSFSGSMASFWI
uniref:Uncharacterized protein n=1 Tax=Arundo donax TaxID=35708 RepID=A0A0A9F7Z0_ARUDO